MELWGDEFDFHIFAKLPFRENCHGKFNFMVNFTPPINSFYLFICQSARYKNINIWNWLLVMLHSHNTCPCLLTVNLYAPKSSRWNYAFKHRRTFHFIVKIMKYTGSLVHSKKLLLAMFQLNNKFWELLWSSISRHIQECITYYKKCETIENPQLILR